MAPRILNETDIPTKAFEVFIDFIQELLPTTAVASFEFLDREPGKVCISGLATRRVAEDYTGPFPGLVQLWITQKGTTSYPRLDQYVPELPAVLLRSWEEELFLVLAHELRHIHQFYTRLWRELNDAECELDAEEFAYQALQLWRQRSPGRRCLTHPKRAA
jgi:hypothetical protein